MHASHRPSSGSFLPCRNTLGYYARYLTGDRNAALRFYAGLLVLAWLPMLVHGLTPRRALPADDA